MHSGDSSVMPAMYTKAKTKLSLYMLRTPSST